MRRLLLPILSLLVAASLYAQDPEKVATETRIAKQSSTEDGDRGLFTTPSVETLNKKQYSFGYAWTGVNRSPRDITVTSLPFFVSYGLFGRLTLTGMFDTDRQLTAHNLAQPGFNTSYPLVNQRFSKGYGDTVLSGKYRFQRRSDNVGGIAFRGAVKFGTADSKTGLGTGGTDVGADVIFTSALPWKFLLDSNIGFTSIGNAKDATGTVRRLKNGMRSGLGTAWPAEGFNILKGQVQGLFEYATLTYVGGGSSNAASSIQDASDIAFGMRYLSLDNGVTLTAGYRRNTKLDLTFPGNTQRNGFSFSISYSKPVRPPGNNRFPVVSLETSPDQVQAGGTATITATGYDADNDSLTYAWSASAGKIVGSGEKITFDTAGLTPGTYTVRATVSDGRGGTGTAAIDVTVRQ